MSTLQRVTVYQAISPTTDQRLEKVVSGCEVEVTPKDISRSRREELQWTGHDESCLGSFFAPLPIVGPRIRWYPLRSGRLALEGAFQGMSFFR